MFGTFISLIDVGLVVEHTTAILQTCVCPFVSTAYILALLFLQAPVKGYKRLHTFVVHLYTVLPQVECLRFAHNKVPIPAMAASITLSSSIPSAILTSNRSTFRSFPRFQGQGQHHVTLVADLSETCLLYTSPSPRDRQKSRMPSSA